MQDIQNIDEKHENGQNVQEFSDKVIHNNKSRKHSIFDLYTKLSTFSTEIK